MIRYAAMPLNDRRQQRGIARRDATQRIDRHRRKRGDEGGAHRRQRARVTVAGGGKDRRQKHRVQLARRPSTPAANGPRR